MEALSIRPKLVSFRAIRFHGENSESITSQSGQLDLTQTIQVGLAKDDEDHHQFHVMVKIDFVATARQVAAGHKAAEFSAGYEARYDYPVGVNESQLTALLAHEAYQYMIVAQAFPLAMTHFRRELKAFGVNVRGLPLGI